MLVKKKLVSQLAVSTVAMLLLIVGAVWLFGPVPEVKGNYDIAKTIRYSFQVTNNSSQHIDAASFSVFAPVKQNAFQMTRMLRANLPFTLDTDQSGNQALVFELKDLAPFASQVVNITAQVNLASTPQPFGPNPDSLLGEEEGIETSAPEINVLVERLAGQPEQINSWLYSNITDIGYVMEDRGARYAVTEKRGDCTEFASAFVALARASNIPARMIGGFTVSHSGRLRAENYHNWAEFRRHERWNIADPQNNNFDSNYGSYIAFYNFDQHSRLENSQRFLAYDRRLSVQMN
ncbi:transglutaminase-like domain-containing protein [Microbulbifer sp. 2201CG32-9]|uniref:transglutaminase-like domain-containing protein n=1 Tax=Microbulbifer sp. 2201CG32-9 TaxID=3232309 RepID=UPI00345BB3BC